MLFIYTMQKLLNTRRLTPFLLLQRALLLGRPGLLAGLLFVLFAGLSAPAKAASGFTEDYAVINGVSRYTNSNAGSTAAPYQGSNLGSFDRGTGQLSLGALAKTTSDGGDDVQTVELLYRVYLQGAAPGSFAPLVLGAQTTTSDGTTTTKGWVNTSTLPNLLNATSGPGAYVLELYFQGYGVNSGAGTNFNIFDNAGGTDYKANFTVTGSVPAQWTGAVDNSWFTAGNWSTGVVPNRTTDVTVPYIAGQPSYPTITGSQPLKAVVRTLRIEGQPNNTMGGRVFLQGSELKIIGDFQDKNGGFVQTGGNFILGGTNQTFDGASFTNFKIEGGGTKTLTNRMDVSNRLVLGSGTIVTRTDNTSIYSIDLGGAATMLAVVNQATGQTGPGDTETGYVLGVIRTTRTVGTATPSRFGNLGVELSATGISPGPTRVTRVTNVIYHGIGTSVSIARSFTFAPARSNLTNFSIVFHYLKRETVFKPYKLTMFRSASGGNPFESLGKTSYDSTAKTVTRTGISGNLAALFTLGDITNPLPVRVTSFTAVAQGPNALISWATAQEVNNRGFEVQASADGTTFSTLGFVAAHSPNSSEAQNYGFREVGAGRTPGTRYYRLRQLDLDGAESFFGPLGLAFGATDAAPTARAYPNPFGAALNLALQSPVAGTATVEVRDGLGRSVRTYRPVLAAGASEVPLDGLQGLPAGLYLVQIVYPGGQTQRLKLLKE